MRWRHRLGPPRRPASDPDAGFNHHLVKPVAPEALQSLLAAVSKEQAAATPLLDRFLSQGLLPPPRGARLAPRSPR